VTALRGMEGTVTGLVADAFDRLAADEVDTLYDFKGQPAQEFRLVFADVNIPVVPPQRHPGPASGGHVAVRAEPDGVVRLHPDRRAPFRRGPVVQHLGTGAEMRAYHQTLASTHTVSIELRVLDLSGNLITIAAPAGEHGDKSTVTPTRTWRGPAP
jgi:hypothetical protein